MSLSKETISNIAKLARLEVEEKEMDELSRDINNILDYMEKLNNLNTDNVEPLSHPIPLTNVYREDEVKNEFDSSDALKNSPVQTEKFFVVPRVI